MRNNSPKFSIVIPTRAINDFIREAIPYHLKQSFQDFEIIIVTEAEEKEKFSKTRIIRVGKIPPSEKRNVGVENAKGEIIAFIDDDAYPEENWLENASKIFKDSSIAALGGPGLVPKNATFFQRVSSKVYELSSTKTGERYGKGKKKEINDWPTCNFFARKELFKKSGGFDSKYWGGEDSQLCYSLLNFGRIIYDPEVVVYHHPRKDLKNHLKQTIFWGMWRGFFMRLHPKNSITPVFFIPSIFLIWLVVGGALSFFFKEIFYIYLFILALYLLYLIYLGIKSNSLKLFFPVIAVSFLTQMVYALGLIRGIVFSAPANKTFNPSEKMVISQK